MSAQNKCISDTSSDESRDDNTADDCGQMWIDGRGRTSFKGDDGVIIYISQLTAVAEHGFAAVKNHDHIHHTLQSGGKNRVRINVREWLHPVNTAEHTQIHSANEWCEVDDIPLLLPDDDNGPDAMSDVEDTNVTAAD